MPTNDLASLRQKLGSAKQDSTLRFYDQLPAASQAKLSAQLNALDLATLPKLISEYVTAKPDLQLPKEIKPVKTYPRVPKTEEHRALYELAKARGLDLLKQGKIGAFLVAGGQGTRLGYDGPKGEYLVTPIKNKPFVRSFRGAVAGPLARFGETGGVVHHDQRGERLTHPCLLQKEQLFRLQPR